MKNNTNLFSSINEGKPTRASQVNRGHLHLLFLLIILSLTACTTQSTPQPTPTSQPSSTLTITPTITSTPEPTLTPSTTPLSGGTLNEKGPWLMYQHEDKSIYYVNPDGTGKTRLPIEQPAQNLHYSIRVSGDLLALYNSISDSGQITIYLEIYSLPDLTKRQSIKVDSYLWKPPGDQNFDTSKGKPIHSWSPDGRYLAFSVVMNELSTDLYVYDSISDDIKNISSIENAIGKMEWSPDSKRIVYEEVADFHGWNATGIWASSADGSENKWLYEPQYHDGQKIRWVDNDRFISIGNSSKCSRIPNVTTITTNQHYTLYNGCVDSMYDLAVDVEHELIAFRTVADGTLPSEENGIYLVSLNSPYLRLVEPVNYSIYFFDEQQDIFITNEKCLDENGENGKLGFKHDGVLKCVQPTWKPIIRGYLSPDQKWIIPYKSNEVCSYPENDRSFTYEIGQFIAIWRPDSQGYFLYTDETLHYIPLDTLTPVLIDDDLGYTDDDSKSIPPQWIGE